MKNKRKIRIPAVLMAVMLCMAAFSMPAYAYVEETETEADTGAVQETEAETESNPVSLTPEGNLTLVDDIDGEQAEDKQFITVVTKSGNYFYLIIDRSSDSENVYFLNQVDEADLMALIEDADGAVASTTSTIATSQETEVTTGPDTSETEATAETETGGGNNGILIAVLVIALAGGGAFYYFKVLKPKQGAKGGTHLDDFDFEDDEDEETEPEVFEDEQEDTEE